MSDVVDRGRICVVVDKYPKRENGQDVYENGAQVMKNKYMAIGECTKWRDNTGRENITRKIMLNPPSLPCEQYEFWDSESKQGQPQPQQQGGFNQQPQQGGQQQPQGGGRNNNNY